MRKIATFFGVLAAALASAKAGDSRPWVTHRDASGVYSIQFPSTPKVKVQPNGEFMTKPAEAVQLEWNNKNYGFLVQVYELDNRWHIQGKEREFLDRTANALIIKGSKRTAGPTRFAWQGAPGAFLRFKSAKMESLTYLVLHDRHYFRVVVAGKPGAIDMKASQRFVNSLKFL